MKKNLTTLAVILAIMGAAFAQTPQKTVFFTGKTLYATLRFNDHGVNSTGVPGADVTFITSPGRHAACRLQRNRAFHHTRSSHRQGDRHTRGRRIQTFDRRNRYRGQPAPQGTQTFRDGKGGRRTRPVNRRQARSEAIRGEKANPRFYISVKGFPCFLA